MPDRASAPVYDICPSCALTAEKGPVYHAAWPISHTEICCLHKFNRQEQSALCGQLKGEGQKPNCVCGGWCKDCPSRPKFRQLQVQLPVEEPVPLTSTDTTSSEGATDVPPSCTSVHSRPRRSSKITPRKRRGFTKLTIEIRPPRFKKKLWFGTWQEDEIARAKDAINYYMGSNEPFHLPDSPFIFAQHRLGIDYHDLAPSCEDYVEVANRKVRASVYFARRVKEVIKAVTRGGKKKPQAPKRPPKSKLAAPPLPEENTQSMPCSSAVGMIIEEVHPSASSSSSVPCASGDNMAWGGASFELVQSPSEMLTYGGELQMEELESLCDWSELEGLPFSSSPSLAAASEGEGESGASEDQGFSELLWS